MIFKFKNMSEDNNEPDNAERPSILSDKLSNHKRSNSEFVKFVPTGSP